MLRRAFTIAILCLQAASSAVAGQPTQDGLDFFEREIRPLLAERCFKCHGEKKAKAGLRLDSRASILRGGDTGPAAIQGRPEQSLIIQAIRHENGLEMPPGEQLKSADIDRVVRWIRSGMYWPEVAAKPTARGNAPSFTEEQRNFWSLQPVKSAAPQVSTQS